MAASSPPPLKSRYLPVAVGLLGGLVVLVLGTLACLLLTLRTPPAAAPATRRPVATATSLLFDLPTAAPPTATPGPPLPQKISFKAKEPIKGFSDCQKFGFKGSVTGGNGKRLQGVQIVVWDDQNGLLALKNSDAEGNYLITLADEPARHRLWVQVYENDLPVSRPVFVETNIDCQNGFQIYQIDWQKLDP